jgi:hypothetical protein
LQTLLSGSERSADEVPSLHHGDSLFRIEENIDAFQWIAIDE